MCSFFLICLGGHSAFYVCKELCINISSYLDTDRALVCDKLTSSSQRTSSSYCLTTEDIVKRIKNSSVSLSTVGRVLPTTTDPLESTRSNTHNCKAGEMTSVISTLLLPNSSGLSGVVYDSFVLAENASASLEIEEVVAVSLDAFLAVGCCVFLFWLMRSFYQTALRPKHAFFVSSATARAPYYFHLVVRWLQHFSHA